MASAICNSWKTDILDGIQLAAHTFKIALYTNAATLDKNTTAYSATNEVANGGGYTTGGMALAGRSVALSGDVGYISFTDPTWTSATITARYALIYDSTLAGKNAVCVIDFGADIVSTNGPFTVDLPAAGAAALLRIN